MENKLVFFTQHLVTEVMVGLLVGYRHLGVGNDFLAAFKLC